MRDLLQADPDSQCNLALTPTGGAAVTAFAAPGEACAAVDAAGAPCAAVQRAAAYA